MVGFSSRGSMYSPSLAPPQISSNGRILFGLTQHPSVDRLKRKLRIVTLFHHHQHFVLFRSISLHFLFCLFRFTLLHLRLYSFHLSWPFLSVPPSSSHPLPPLFPSHRQSHSHLPLIRRPHFRRPLIAFSTPIARRTPWTQSICVARTPPRVRPCASSR